MSIVIFSSTNFEFHWYKWLSGSVCEASAFGHGDCWFSLQAGHTLRLLKVVLAALVLVFNIWKKSLDRLYWCCQYNMNGSSIRSKCLGHYVTVKHHYKMTTTCTTISRPCHNMIENVLLTLSMLGKYFSDNVLKYYVLPPSGSGDILLLPWMPVHLSVCLSIHLSIIKYCPFNIVHSDFCHSCVLIMGWQHPFMETDHKIFSLVIFTL